MGFTNPTNAVSRSGNITPAYIWSIVITHIIIICSLLKNVHPWMAIDIHEEELTFLQKKEAMNEKQLEENKPHVGPGRSMTTSVFQKFPQTGVALGNSPVMAELLFIYLFCKQVLVRFQQS